MKRRQRLRPIIIFLVSQWVFCVAFIAPSRLANQYLSHHDVISRESDGLPRNLGHFELAKNCLKSTKLCAASGVNGDVSKPSTLDNVLSSLTSDFPFFVLGSAILGLFRPSTLMWTNQGSLISWMLASVMCATGKCLLLTFSGLH